MSLGKQAPPAAPLSPWSWPTKPWQRVHLDFAGPFLNKMYLLAVDAHSKWPEVFEMSQTTSLKTISVLRHLFAKYGLPEQIVSDNGPQFISEEFETFMKSNGVKHTRCSPYHPSSNGAVERFVRTFKQAMKAGDKDGLTPQHRLENFLLTYRTTPHSTTNVTPSSLFLGRNIRTRLDMVRPDVSQTVFEKQASQKQNHDRHVRPREFVVGQKVMVKSFKPGPNYLPGTITDVVGPLTYTVCVNGLLLKRHIDHIKALDSRNVQDEFRSVETSGTEFTDLPSTSQNEPSDSQVDTQTSTSEVRYPQRNRQPPNRLEPHF